MSGCWVVLAVLGRSLVELSSRLGVRFLKKNRRPLFTVKNRTGSEGKGRYTYQQVLHFPEPVQTGPDDERPGQGTLGTSLRQHS